MLESSSFHPPSTLVGRDAALALARDLLAIGADIDILGTAGSGRTSVIDALATASADDQVTVVRINGIRSLRGNPLAALHAAGIGSQLAADRRPVSPLQNAIDALAIAVGTGRSVIMVDDSDLLDDASIGAIEAVRRLTRVPLVRSRHHLDATGAEAAGYVIELGPLRYDELETVLSSRLDGSIDASTMSRLYAKSGGSVGLALTIVDLAAREGRMVRENGAWAARKSLWSPSLRGAIESYLAGLDDTHREALELIALVGMSDLDTALTLCDSTVLEDLEDAGVLRLVPSGSRQLVTVDPPLLAEFYRHEASAVRRQRLTAHARSVLGTVGSLEAIFADQRSVPQGLGDSDALFVRLVHERSRTRRVVAEAEWRGNPDAGTAYAYLRALLADSDSEDLVTRTFAETVGANGDPIDVAKLAVLNAHWHASSGWDLTSVLAELNERVKDLGSAKRLGDAASVLLETSFGTIPDDADARLATTPGLPVPVQKALLEANMVVAVLRGRFRRAHALFDELTALDAAAIPTSVLAMHGFTLLGEGRYADALSWSERGIDEAHAQLDVPGLRAHSFVAAFCLTTAGQYAEAEQVISTALALGEPSLTDMGDHLGIQSLASIIAVRRDNPSLGEKLRTDIQASPASRSLRGGTGLAWSTAQLIAYRGQPVEASQTLSDHANRLGSAGIVFWSALARLAALEMNADEAALTAVGELLGGVESEFLVVLHEFLTARQKRDVDGILALVPRLTETGRPGLGVVAHRLAAEWLSADGQPDRARKVEEEKEAYIAVLPVRTYDATRYSATAINLTEREREISNLVASGLTNPQIAARLVLSVRTVESHLHRIMRKTSVANRSELAALIRSIAA